MAVLKPVLKSFPVGALQKDNFRDENLEMVQSNSGTAWSSLKNHPMLSGRLITDVEVSATEVLVAHKLGRVPKGYFLASATTPIVIYTTGMDNKFLKIASSGPDTISLWVF
jgi:hypothetical protein